MTAYFQRLAPGRFHATPAVQGAWNIAEQHIAPALGLLTHAVETDRAARRDDDLHVARLSFDILGTMPIDEVRIDVRVLRPGRTIELVEATLDLRGRVAVILRAWLQKPGDTGSISGTALPRIRPRDDLEPWEGSVIWPGEFVRTVEARRLEISPGRAQYWLRPRVPLLAGEPISSTAAALSVLDIANGITPRLPPVAMAFPNLDTTVHLFERPRSDWIGYDTTVTFGTNGIGLTHTVLHDIHGPIGTAEQILTIRPR
ncbi:thioesterase family protein [Micromonospora sp. DT81.3]|uniref:thioesterase family protein n=1 Tax=Micromonospora sp. DT81.3 TaxID=3416523 RepID=UPI003CE75446